MQHTDHQTFLQALHTKHKVLLVFWSKEDQAALERVCAPTDFGPGPRAKDGVDRYHFWDYGSDISPHPVAIVPEHIVRMTALPEGFDPGEFVTWRLATAPWSLPRDWGSLS